MNERLTNRVMSLLILLLALAIPVMAQAGIAVEEDPPYDDMFASLAAIVAGVPLMVEAIKGVWKNMPHWASVALNFVLGIAVAMFGWWQDLGFLADLDWQLSLLYGIGAGIAANGFAETGLIQWLISLFARKKKKKREEA